MPIYEYRCASCGHQQEFLQKVSDPPHTQCPKCNQPSLAKMVTAAGFQLKGSGWYATDFRNKGTSTPKTEAKPSEGGGDKGGGDKGGDSKAEAKAAAPAACGANCACH